MHEENPTGADGRGPGTWSVLAHPGPGAVVAVWLGDDGRDPVVAPTAVLRAAAAVDDALVIALLPSDTVEPQAVVRAGLAELGDGPGGIVGVARAAPVTDALKRVDGDRVVTTVDRAGLRRLTAPAVVRADALRAALEGVQGDVVRPLPRLARHGRLAPLPPPVA